MTVIQDPYEEPEGPDVIIDTAKNGPEAGVRELIERPGRLGKL